MSHLQRNVVRATFLSAIAVSLLTVASSAVLAAPPTRTYRVTIENLTPVVGTNGSQVFSPALVIVHDRSFDLFTVGETANQAVIDVAEEGNTTTGTDMFRTIGGVTAATSEGTRIAAGDRLTFEVTADNDARYLSLVTMLGNTNDGFTGLDAVHLTGGTKTYRVFAYDAGSEVNDQLRASISGPCCNDLTHAGTPENGVITRHPGFVAGTGDLTAQDWGWPANQPVALITVERIRD
jgi:hypothetical protein